MVLFDKIRLLKYGIFQMNWS